MPMPALKLPIPAVVIEMRFGLTLALLPKTDREFVRGYTSTYDFRAGWIS